MQFSCRSFQTRRRMDKRLTRCAVAQRSHMAASPIGFMERGWLWSELYVRQGAHCHRRHVVGRDEEHFPRAWVEVIRRLAVRNHRMTGSSRGHQYVARYCCGMFQEATPHWRFARRSQLGLNYSAVSLARRKQSDFQLWAVVFDQPEPFPGLAPCLSAAR
jgi:hypothetical protein